MRILLVDDSPVSRHVAALMLERAGHRVARAESGRAALRLLEKDEFDVVLMDVEMPDIDGPEATTLMRRRGHAAVPVVALTAHTQAAERERCLGAGMNDVLNKPFRVEELVGAVERSRRCVATEKPG